MTPLHAGNGEAAIVPWASRRLWSLWDMLELNASEFYQASTSLVRMTSFLQAHKDKEDSKFRENAIIGEPEKTFVIEGLVKIEGHLKILNARVTAMAVGEVLSTLRNEAAIWGTIRDRTEEIMRTLQRELKLTKLFVLERTMERYFSPEAPPFGLEVEKNLSSANDDIYEACKCLALGRATACVMHLNRALEVGLKVLANELGVKHQNDWGSYLREIDKELAARYKIAGARSADEQFYAEASANFDRLRRAYRNPTMHPEKTYSEDRAEEVLMGVKAFMSHLATKLREPALVYASAMMSGAGSLAVSPPP